METVELTCEKLVKGKFHNYERVTKAFQKFFCQDEIMSIIERKADTSVITPILEAKATKDELK